MDEILGLISGGIWSTRPVSAQPSLTAVRWQIRQTLDGQRHVVGYVPENREGRVSSAIATFDPASMRCVTSTGRVYQLQGPPGGDSDAEYVWNAWTRINRVTEWSDVTAEVWAARVDLHKPAARGSKGG